MKENYIDLNKKFWNRKYFAPNVEGYIFRLKPILLDNHTNFNLKKKIKILDFGCGEGSNVKYFLDKFKFIPYGVDISEASIRLCKKKMKRYKNNFKIIKPRPKSDDDFFKTKFDLIISAQTLYYLSNEDLKNRLSSLKRMLKPNGFVFFTMMSKQCASWTRFSNKKINSAGLTLVNLNSHKKLKKRQKQPTYRNYINFVCNEKDLVKKFKLFKKIVVGSYDTAIESLRLSGHHFTFFGKKY